MPSLRGDAGFTLIETIVGLFIMSVVVTSAVPLIIATLQATTGLGTKQAAIAVASQQLEYVRSLSPAQLVTGRRGADVDALIASPGLVNLSGDVKTSGNRDPNATTSSANAAVPLTTTTTVNGVVYTARNYINLCYLSALTGLCTTDPMSGKAMYRVWIDVSWPRGPGVQCQSARAGQCEYVASTLLDSSVDPVFSTSGVPSLTSVMITGTSSALVVSSPHPGQQIPLTFNGANFAYGASVTSALGDAASAATNNTGSSLDVVLKLSSTLGTRQLSVVNPNGASASTTFTVVKSAPTVWSITPATVPSGVTSTFTLNGTDFFATPTNAAPTKRPVVTLSGGVTATGANVTVISSTKLTFQATLSGPGTKIGTLTVTNPDGGTTSFPYLIGVS